MGWTWLKKTSLHGIPESVGFDPEDCTMAGCCLKTLRHVSHDFRDYLTMYPLAFSSTTVNIRSKTVRQKPIKT